MKESAGRVYIVDDDPAIRRSLRCLFEAVDLSVESYGSPQEFLDAYKLDGPGCLLLDVRLPGMSGLELQEQLNDRRISLPVIILTGHGEVPAAVRALKAGAVDFIEKPAKPQMLLDHVQEAIRQDAQAQRQAAHCDTLKTRLASLTRRERQVMDLLVAGKSAKGIALDLGLSPKTVRIHRSQVMAKMQASSLIELVRIADVVGI